MTRAQGKGGGAAGRGVSLHKGSGVTSHWRPAAAGPALVSVPARHLSNKCSHTNTTRRQTSAPERRETTSHHPISLGGAPATPTTRLPPAGRSIRGRGRATTSVSSVQTPFPSVRGFLASDRAAGAPQHGGSHAPADDSRAPCLDRAGSAACFRHDRSTDLTNRTAGAFQCVRTADFGGGFGSGTRS